MRLAAAGLIGLTTLLVSACGGPAVGSPEWCKGVMEGKIQPTQEQAQGAMACVGAMMKDALGGLQTPGQ